MWFKFRKNKNQSTNQFATQKSKGGNQKIKSGNQTVKGGINLNVETNNALETVMAHMDRVHKEMFEKVAEMKTMQTKMNKAFDVYVRNNGVKPEIKKIVSEILQ